MIKSRRNALVLSLITIILFYGWLILFWENQWMRSIGAFLFPIIAGLISFTWLTRTYLYIPNKHRYFWLMLAGGVLIYTFSIFSWLITQITQAQNSILPTILWFVAYSIFLVALIYRIKLMSSKLMNKHYIFNIVIFMIVISTICIHFLIYPIMLDANSPTLEMVLTIAYTIVDLGIFLAISSLYYLSQTRKEKKSTVYLVLGFFILIMADLVYAYGNLMMDFQLGGLVNPAWAFALLILGFAGLTSKEIHTSPAVESKLGIKGIENTFPYLSILLLTLLVIDNYNWNFNALSIGLSIIFFLVIVRHILIIKQNEKLVDEYKYLAYHDPLTDLLNRTQYTTDVTYIMKKAKEVDEQVAVLLIDLDRFKDVNDTLGHKIGDYLLIEAAKRLRHILEIEEKLYRVGGDEFIIILPSINDHTLENRATSILQQFERPFLIKEYEINITPSIGISLYPQNGEDGETLLKNADTAMYLAKGRGKNNYQYYNSSLNKRNIRKVTIENALRKALENDELTLAYQPKINLQSRDIDGMEALLRWKNPELGAVSPSEFIPIAEETGQIISIGKWVLKTACKKNKEWHDKGLPKQCVSVNVSVRQFQHSDFVSTVRSILRDTGLRPEYLELEITESIMQNIKESTEVLKGLRNLGVKISLDDFGTGYSSLHILRELPIDTIKIDKSFIDDVADSAKRSMVRTIIDLGLNLDLSVVAEGIENEQQARILSDYHCKFGQGYLFSKPIYERDFEKLLTVRTPLNVK
ncbi:EAL domain-containing protein [Ornithinibacillus sp. L9]|uniref:EAL domain-containing protein n=1 Tax=Ornithinibacillus caprae TaxID=2678566 RepID=A0A6N8FFD4_9BACI|nr:EAL domain-containing protein [Ornithinibacillus caprae]MUK88392.1 EAL domain-containing protein [Ornithinibacillus caprae]